MERAQNDPNGPRKVVQLRNIALLTFAVILYTVAATLSAQAQTYTVLFTFTAANIAWGMGPNSTLIQDAAGNFYGTTEYGGAYGHDRAPDGAGTVFQLDPNGNLRILYAFAKQYGDNDGLFPSSPLVRDAAGNLYGTTWAGGDPACFCGMVYKLGAHGLTVLHTFKTSDPGGNPSGGLFRQPWGVLYGTAFGDDSTPGSIFKLDASGNYTVLHRFLIDTGAGPVGPLVGGGTAGILYGVTNYGGGGTCGSGFGCGTVYKMTATGGETVLHRFNNGADGGYPVAGLLLDASGNLYGTASQGGDAICQCGVVFKIDLNGQYTVIHSFIRGADGATPKAGLVEDTAGNLYGTTSSGGASNVGTIFKIDTAGNETILYSFTGGADGASPNGLLLSGDGALYGTTFAGGDFAFRCSANAGCGVIFKVTL